jgi:Anti-sigma factor NepR
MLARQGLASPLLIGWVVKDKTKMNDMSVPRSRRAGDGGDGLGPNSDIGAKLRAFYGAVQDQPIPDKFLDLLEKLDQVEQASKRKGS